MKAFRVAGVVDDGGLNALCGRDTKNGCNESGGHPCKEIAEWGEGVGLWIGEGVLNGIKG